MRGASQPVFIKKLRKFSYNLIDSATRDAIMCDVERNTHNVNNTRRLNMDERTYTIAGTSVLNDVLTYRFANGDVGKRAKVLDKNGHKNILLQTLPSAMMKPAAIAFLNSKGIFAVLPNGPKAQAADPAAAPATVDDPAAVAALLDDTAEVTSETVAEVTSETVAEEVPAVNEEVAALLNDTAEVTSETVAEEVPAVNEVTSETAEASTEVVEAAAKREAANARRRAQRAAAKAAAAQ